MTNKIFLVVNNCKESPEMREWLDELHGIKVSLNRVYKQLDASSAFALRPDVVTTIKGIETILEDMKGAYRKFSRRV